MPGREALIRELRADGIRDKRVLAALERVPREEFVAPELRGAAYSNEALPIAQGQTISQPFVVALMTSALELQGDESVLDVGTGSGYQAAVLSLLARRVVGVERHPDMVSAAAERLQRLGYHNVEIHVAGPALGWPEQAPYDAIVCAAAAPHVPASLIAQLALGPRARLVIPVGAHDEQQLVVVARGPDGLVQRTLGAVRFVPLIGLDAWSG